MVECRPLMSAGAFLLLCSGLAPASADRVDDYIRREMRSRHIPGVSVAVVRHGKLLRARGYGLANVEAALPATRDTVYQLASVTKQFTAAAVLMLVDEGKIRLDDRITQRLEGLPAAWGEVTIWQLLSHTSGIKCFTEVPVPAGKGPSDGSREEIIQRVTDLPLQFAPGERWAYSNTGYYLLGMLVEKVSGQEFGAFLNERIFRPLGMISTRMNSPREIIRNRACGYAWEKDGLRNGEAVTPPYSAGGLVSTAVDLAKWDGALFQRRLLKSESLEQMWSGARLIGGRTCNYGFGWFVDSYRTRRRISHSGDIAGFSTDISRFVDDGVTVIVLANSDAAAAETLSSSIAAFYIPALVANAPKPIADPDPETTSRLREVMKGIATGSADREWFTPEAQRMLFPDRIEWIGRFLGPGAVPKRFELMEQGTEMGKRKRSYRAVLGGLTLRCHFLLTEEGKIAGLGMAPER